MTFSSNPRRDAHATIAGFVFQVNVTILRWLNLQANEHLELEAGEDIDLIQKGAASSGSEDRRIMEQLKRYLGRSLTLSSAEALEAIANFCEHRNANPRSKLKFRYLTTANLGMERGWTETASAIETWERVRSGTMGSTARAKAIQEIRTFLLRRRRPQAISQALWQTLRSSLSHSDPDHVADLISTFEWATGSGDHEAVEAEILGILEKAEPGRTPEATRSAYRDLFAFVFRLLCAAGRKQLTTDLLAAELKSSSLTEKDLLAAARLRDWIDRVDSILKRHEEDINELKARIPLERSKTFYDPNLSPEHLSKTGLLFDFNQTLRGRAAKLSELEGFLSHPTHRIAILPGRGGIGKTKLLRDWSRGITGSKVLWVSKHGVWHDATIAEIPPEDTVIIADDAHHYSDLDKLISFVCGRTGEPQLRLVIATRPSGQAYIDELLARIADESAVVRYEALRQLGKTATLEIAKEMLGRDYEHLAEWLAEVSKDTPLVTVVGGKLIARGQITPNLLANDLEFRRNVFDKFADECAGQLPVGGRPKRELLELIAAVHPIDQLQDDFVINASVFLSLRPDQIRRGLDSLERTEILIRSGGKLRIVPDLFADYLLESASVAADGTTNGFADAVFGIFEQSYLANLLKNFAELDWRIKQGGSQSRLLQNIWSSILARFEKQDAAERNHFLSAAKDIAMFQPVEAARLIQIAMDHEAQSVKQWTLRWTHQHVLAELPALLGITIFDERTSDDAFNRLWLLAQHESADVSRPAQQTLKEAIGYRKYKSVVFNERILALVEKRAEDIASYQGQFTPLDLAEELLDREVDITERKGRAITISAQPVNYEAIKALRERALRIIDHALDANEPQIAVRAVRSLGSVLAEFHPKFRASVTEGEQDWQDAERLGSLDLLRKRLNKENVPLQVVWRIKRTLRWIASRDKQSATVRERAAELLGELPRPEFFDFFDVLCTGEYEDNTEADGFSFPSLRRREQQNAAIESVREKFPRTNDQIQAFESFVQQAIDARIELKSADPVLTQMCGDRTFLEGLSAYLLKNERSNLAYMAGVAVREWRSRDTTQYSRYGLLFAQCPNAWVASSVASAVSYGPPLSEPIPEDLEILNALVKRKEPFVLASVLVGLRRLARVDAFSTPAVALFTNLDLSENSDLGKEYCNLVGPHGVSSTLLDKVAVAKIFGNLVAVETLDRDAFGSLVANVCGIAPLAFVSFLGARIAHHQKLEKNGQDTDYEAIPSCFSWSTLSASRQSPDYETALRSLRNTMRRAPEQAYHLISIFWRIGTTDTTTFMVLDELLHTSDPDDAGWVIELLGEAPTGLALNYPMFAIHVLAACSDLSEDLERAAINRLVGNCFSTGGFRAMSVHNAAAGSTSTNSTQISAESLLTQFRPGSLGFRLYTEIAKARQPEFPRAALSEMLDDLEDIDAD